MRIGKTEYVGQNSVEKRTFAIMGGDNPQYPQTIQFELFKDKVSLGDQIQIGQEIKVHFNIQGRDWTNHQGKTINFITLGAWKIEAMGYAPQTQNTQQQYAQPQYQAPAQPQYQPPPPPPQPQFRQQPATGHQPYPGSVPGPVGGGPSVPRTTAPYPPQRTDPNGEFVEQDIPY